MTNSRGECNHPIGYSFAAVNDFVHAPDVNFEELQGCCLGMAAEIDRLMGIIVQAHDNLLVGYSDKDILDLLTKGWSEGHNAGSNRRSEAESG